MSKHADQPSIYCVPVAKLASRKGRLTMIFETDDDLIIDEPSESEDLSIEVEMEGHDLGSDMKDEGDDE